MDVRQVTEKLGDLSRQQNLVTFRLARQIYALPIEPIVRIIEMVTITPLPQVGGSVEGVINMHGRTVPVINLRRHFGFPEIPFALRTPIIILKVGGQTFGLIVDEVIDVLNLLPQQVSRVAEILPEGVDEEPILDGILHDEGHAVLLLNVQHLFTSQQVKMLSRAMAILPDEFFEGEEPPVEQHTDAESDGATADEAGDTAVGDGDNVE